MAKAVDLSARDKPFDPFVKTSFINPSNPDMYAVSHCVIAYRAL